MQVILQENVKNLGMIGDTVNVASGFYRNFLGPRGLALIANPSSLKQLEHQKKIIEAKKVKAKTSALETKQKMEALQLNIEHKAGLSDKLFGSITNQEIVLLLRNEGFDVDRKYILLDEPIKTVGDHKIKVKLHPDVIAECNLSVIKKNQFEEKVPQAFEKKEAIKKARVKKTAAKETKKE